MSLPITHITLKLTDTHATITNKINGALAQEMNHRVGKKRSYVLSRVRDLVGVWVRSQPEMLSLHAADPKSLAAHFGIPFGSADAAIAHIVMAIQNSTNFMFKKFDLKLQGGIFLGIQPEDFGNLLGLRSGHVLTKKGQDLHWLSWLLDRGRDTIITGYHYTPETAPRGRSGGGTMGRGSAWRVPPQFAGTKSDNFVTRAFDGREDDIVNVFHRVLAR